MVEYSSSEIVKVNIEFQLVENLVLSMLGKRLMYVKDYSKIFLG